MTYSQKKIEKEEKSKKREKLRREKNKTNWPYLKCLVLGEG